MILFSPFIYHYYHIIYNEMTRIADNSFELSHRSVKIFDGKFLYDSQFGLREKKLEQKSRILLRFSAAAQVTKKNRLPEEM